MSRSHEQLNDGLFRFIGIPFLAVMSHIIFFNESHGAPDEKFTQTQVLLISIIEAILLWECNRLLLIYYRKRYPELEQSLKRIVSEFLGCMVVTILLRYLLVWFYDKTLFWGYIFPPEGYLYNIFVGMLYVAIVGGIYEGLYYFRKWRQLFAEKEILKRENLQTQLDSLKAQINPHFLFNNLGSLSSLIMEDQHRAVQFVEQLSSVYRYLLQSNQQDMATLKSELDFIENYYSLLKTRFGTGIEMEVNIDSNMLQRMIAPLTIQLLIENAVKHNTVMPEKPLLITMRTESERLIVENRLQPRSSAIVSLKTGLKNIRDKYRILSSEQVLIQQTNEIFSISIPLLKEDVYESSNH